MEDKYLEEQRRLDKCRELLREVLRDAKYEPFHRHLQNLHDNAMARLCESRDMVDVAREQGRVQVLKDLLEDLFLETQLNG